MSPQLIWNNLVAYSLQLGVLVAIAGCMPALLRLRQPNARLYFWRLALAACLILPLVRSWRTEVVSGVVQITTGAMTVVSGPAPHARLSIPWAELALAVVALGICVRLAMLAAGFWRLGRYRRNSIPLPGAPAWRDVSMRLCADIAGPVTFGFFRPVILLPERFPELDAPTRDAILHHEMLHVARFDWLETVVEEFVRAALWFHPAIWWLLGEVQLTREQAVDREVIAATNAHEQYVDALLTIARVETGLDLAPAFLRRRQLKQRVVSILEEAKMPAKRVSKTRVVTTMTLAAGLLAGASWIVTGAFPLRAQTRTVTDDLGVSVDTFGASLQHRSSVLYTESARLKKIEGTVMAQVKLSDTGTVTDAQVLSGPDELRNTVLRSILDWHFAREVGGTTRQVAVTFKAPATTASGPVTVMTQNGPVTVNGTTIPRKIALPAGAANFEPVIAKFNFVDGVLTDDQKATLSSMAPAGTRLSGDLQMRLVSALQQMDEHLFLSFPKTSEGAVVATVFVRPTPTQGLSSQMVSVERSNGVSGGVPGGVSGGVIGGIVGSAPAASNQPKVEGPITIGGRVQSAKLQHSVDPIYPELAKAARIQGKVVLQALIGPDGGVQELSVISGHPMLQQAALQAVRQWIYQPTFLNGQPVSVSTTIEVNFTLSN